MNRICVFAGSSAGRRPDYGRAAADLGRALAGRGIELVYGGARVGLMGVVADAALEAGGQVIGVIPGALADREVAHGGLTDLRVVSSMHERKALMADLSDAFIALPGGFGTWEECFEILTWTQLGVHRKPCGLLNVLGYFDPLLVLVRHAVAEGFLKPEHAALVSVGTSSAGLIDELASARLPLVHKWIDRSTA